MNWFKSHTLTWKQLMEGGEPLNKAYFEGLSSHPIMASKLYCMEHMMKLQECASRTRDPAQCQNEMLGASMCTAQILAPRSVQKYADCMNDGGTDEECVPYMARAFEEAAEVTEQAAQSTAITAAEQKAVKKCGFSQQLDEDASHKAMDCILPLACPKEFEKAAACASSGGLSGCEHEATELMGCVGRFMARVDVVMTKQEIDSRK